MGYWSGRWSLRRAFAALEANRREAYARLSWQLWWLVNSQPHLGNKPRPLVPLWRFDPYAERPERSQAEADAQFNALWNMATDDEEL